MKNRFIILLLLFSLFFSFQITAVKFHILSRDDYYQEVFKNNLTPETIKWHEEQQTHLDTAKKHIDSLKKAQEDQDDDWKESDQQPNVKELNAGPNLATFRIQISWGTIENLKVETFFDGRASLFMSGGDSTLVERFNTSHKNAPQSTAILQSIADYCPKQLGKPADYSLRENIAQFFDLRESLSQSQKDHLGNTFLTAMTDDMFQEFILSRNTKEKIRKLMDSCLDFRFFDVNSKSSLCQFPYIKLVDKREKKKNMKKC